MSELINGGIRFDGITISQLPLATESEGMEFYVTDDVDGPVSTISDGTDWRRTTDKNVVSRT